MSKSKKMFLRIMPVMLMVFVLISGTGFVGAITFDATAGSGGTSAAGVDSFVNNIWATASSVINVLAIAAVVLAGVRYMFAGADQKADIKQQTVTLVIGAVLVFAASNLLTLISGAATSL